MNGVFLINPKLKPNPSFSTQTSVAPASPTLSYPPIPSFLENL